jgi:hypothetical protein
MCFNVFVVLDGSSPPKTHLIFPLLMTSCYISSGGEGGRGREELGFKIRPLNMPKVDCEI